MIKRCKAENKRIFALYNALSEENLAFPNVNIFKTGRRRRFQTSNQNASKDALIL
jgi:hypothetical protein